MNPIVWRLLLGVLIIVTLLCLFGLVTGAGWLSFPLLERPFFPLGNLAAWLLLFLFPFILLLGFRRHELHKQASYWLRFIDSLLVLGATLGMSWGILSRLLSGNWSYVFKNAPAAFDVWIGYTAMAGMLSLIAAAGWLAYAIWRRWGKSPE